MATQDTQPKHIGRYEIKRLLGKGGAGAVYEGLHPTLNRSVAIKTLLDVDDLEDPAALERFKGEAEALAQLYNPNIVTIYDYDDKSEAFPFIVMEYVDGGSLRQRMAGGQALPVAVAVDLTRQILHGLEASHRIPVYHRDIKPANILMRGDRALIADFGIARVADKRSTQVGAIIGTASYMSPEQVRAEADIDGRTDIWSTGVLLYQMLTGRLPFEGGSPLAIMDGICKRAPVPPSERNPEAGISPALDAVVLKALDKGLGPQERFASASAFSQALDDAMQPRSATAAPIGSPAKPPPSAAAKSGSGGRMAMAGVAAAVLLSLGGGAAWYFTSGPVQPVGTMSVTPPLPVPVTPSMQSASLPASVPPTPAALPTRPKEAAEPQISAPPVAAPPPVAVTPPAPFAPPVPVAPPVPLAPPTAAGPQLADLRDAIDTSDCLLIERGSVVEPKRVILRGLGAAPAVARLRSIWQSLRDHDQRGADYNFDIVPFHPVAAYCEMLLLVRPFGGGAGNKYETVSAGISATGGVLKSDSAFGIEVNMADAPGWVQVDYFSGDDVLHAGLSAPGNAPPPKVPPFAIQLGAGQSGLVYRDTATSPSDDIVLVIVSRDRLFAKPRPQKVEHAASYLAELARVLQAQPTSALVARVLPAIVQEK